MPTRHAAPLNHARWPPAGHQATTRTFTTTPAISVTSGYPHDGAFQALPIPHRSSTRDYRVRDGKGRERPATDHSDHAGASVLPAPPRRPETAPPETPPVSSLFTCTWDHYHGQRQRSLRGLIVTEHDRPDGPDCSQIVQITDYARQMISSPQRVRVYRSSGSPRRVPGVGRFERRDHPCPRDRKGSGVQGRPL